MCTSEVADLEMHDIFTDIFPVRQRERMSATVMNLLEELLEKIILLLDPASAINFSLCATRIHGLLSNHITFLRILDKVQFKVADNNEDVEAKAQRTEDNQELVDNIRNFICTTADPGPLLARLQEIISLQFPSKGLAGTWENKDAGTWDWMGDGAIVLEGPLHQPIHVDTEGVLLLLRAREGLTLVSVGVGMNEFVGRGLLAALSSLATKTPERGLELQVFSLMVDTEEDGLALTQLLGGCGDWTVGHLELFGQVGQETWQGLAMAVGRGRVCGSVTTNNQVIRRGTREDLRRVWDCTVGGWHVNWEYLSRDDEEEGWRRIEEWINGEGKSLDWTNWI